MAYQVSSAAIDTPRDSHYIVANDGIAYRTLLLEGQGTNLCLQSENFGTSWVLTGTGSVTSAAIPASVMGVALDLLTDSDGATAVNWKQLFSFTGDGVKAYSIYSAQPPSPAASGNRIRIVDSTTSTIVLDATLTWSGGTPTVAAATGAYIGKIPYASGVYRFLFSTASVTAANPHRVEAYPAKTSTETGNAYFGGAQPEDQLFPTSYIKTTTATVTRSADSLYFPANDAPQEQTLYFKFVERGTAYVTNLRVFQIGSATVGSTPRLYVYKSATGYRFAHDNGSTTVQSADTLTAPVFGDVVELRALLNADGSVQLFQSTNGAAATSTTASAANALGAAWADTRFYINSGGSSNSGFNAFIAVKRLKGIKTLAQCQAA